MTFRFLPARHPDYFLIATVFILTIVGLVILTSASSDLGKTKFDDSFYFLKHQLSFGLLIGIVGFFVGLFFPYQLYKKFSLLLLIVSVVLLALVFTPLGSTVRNTNRWLRFGPISFQPAEVVKLTFIIYIAAWLSGRNFTRARSAGTLSGILPFLFITGTVAVLLLLQPATSTVVILLSSALVIYFLSGVPARYIFYLAGLGILVLALVIYITPYRLARVKTYLNGGSDTQGSGYHINQALIAIGSGGLTGVGWGESTSKIRSLPTPIDDSIFAVAAQELGFIGAGGIVALFAILTMRLFYLAYRVRDTFGKFLLIGFSCIIAFQSIIHIASISGITPLTGIPLPFVSYGGTALAVFLTMMGVCANISRHASFGSR